MVAFNRYSVFPAIIGGVQFQQLGSADLRSGTSKSEPIPGGLTTRQAVINAFADPMSTVRTADLQTAMQTIDLRSGKSWSGPSSYIHFQHRVDGGEFSAPDNAVHHYLTSIKGYCHFTEITANQDDANGVTAGIDIWHLSTDGHSAPVTWAVDQQLNQAPLFKSLYYLADVWVGDWNVTANASILNGVQSVRITPGIQYVPKRAGGDPFAVVGSVVRVMPEIRINTVDFESVAKHFPLGPTTGPVFGFQKKSSGTTKPLQYVLKCYFARGLDGGERFAYNQPQHIAVGCRMIDMTPDSFSATETEDGSIDMIIRPYANALYDPAAESAAGLLFEYNVTIPNGNT